MLISREPGPGDDAVTDRAAGVDFGIRDPICDAFCDLVAACPRSGEQRDSHGLEPHLRALGRG